MLLHQIPKMRSAGFRMGHGLVIAMVENETEMIEPAGKSRYPEQIIGRNVNFTDFASEGRSGEQSPGRLFCLSKYIHHHKKNVRGKTNIRGAVIQAAGGNEENVVGN